MAPGVSRPGTSLPSAGLQRAAWADWATTAGLAAVALITLAGRIRERYAQAGTAQEPGGAPE